MARSARAVLNDEPLWEQGSLFKLPEREQLRAQLADIPAQRERESAALCRRYADPTARWFPAAFTFLVPAGARF